MKKLLIILAMVLMAGGLAGGLSAFAFGREEPTDPAGLNPVSQEESLQIAEEFVAGSPTFQFDGMDGSIELVVSHLLRCPNCYAFTFWFQSRHAGYGDRTGMMLAQVMTDHHAHIAVEQGNVAHAVLDGVWDILTQSYLDDQSSLGISPR